jgi:hypothetical protein
MMRFSSLAPTTLCITISIALTTLLPTSARAETTIIGLSHVDHYFPDFHNRVFSMNVPGGAIVFPSKGKAFFCNDAATLNAPSPAVHSTADSGKQFQISIPKGNVSDLVLGGETVVGIAALSSPITADDGDDANPALDASSGGIFRGFDAYPEIGRGLAPGAFQFAWHGGNRIGATSSIPEAGMLILMAAGLLGTAALFVWQRLE